MTARAKAVMTKIKTKSKNLANLPEQIIKGNMDKPSNILHYRTGLVDVDRGLEQAEHAIQYAKGTKTYERAARMTKPLKNFVQGSEVYGNAHKGLKHINKAKYLTAAIGGATSPIPFSTEAIVAGASVPQMAGYAMSKARGPLKRVGASFGAKALNLVLRGLHHPITQQLMKV